MNFLSHSTTNLPAAARAGHWNSVIAETYFPLQLTFRDAAAFNGRLEHQSLGDLSLSRLQTEPLQYERHPRHIAGTSEEQYLITIPRRSPVEFRQLGREVRCDPGSFIIERLPAGRSPIFELMEVTAGPRWEGGIAGPRRRPRGTSVDH